MILKGLGIFMMRVDYVTTLILESAMRNFASDGELDYMTTANLESIK